MKKCENCGHENNSDYLFCEQCGSKLEKNNNEAIHKEKKETNTKICPKCGFENDIDNKFCTKCGYNFFNNKNVGSDNFKNNLNKITNGFNKFKK